MSTRIKFGTDGWRGVIADDFTVENVRICAQSVATYLKNRGEANRGVVVGYDTRFGSEMFADAVAEVLAGNQIPVYLCAQPTPTPTVSFSIGEVGAAGAVIITASHNPGRYSGFKYRPNYAGAASDEILAELQGIVDATARGEMAVVFTDLQTAERQGWLHRFDPRPAYLKHVAALVDLERILSAPIRIVVDPMYGAGMGYLGQILDAGLIQIAEIHGQRNPIFPGMRAPEPVPANLGPLREHVRADSADIGLALDGDADRLALVDEAGDSVENFEVYPLLLYYLLAVCGQRGPVVKTVATSSLVDRVAERFGVEVITTGVGFKYIAPAMVQSNAIFGGEESGGYAFGDHLPERDGILSGLRVLDLIVRSGKSLARLLADLRAEFGVYYFRRVDMPFPVGLSEKIQKAIHDVRPDRLAGTPVLNMRADDGLRLDLADGSWLLLRLSGTEPVVRLAVEATSEERLSSLLNEGLKLVGLGS